MWPGLTILPEMETGASDSIYTIAAGMPSYGFNGMAIEEGDERAHGRDERLGIESYYAGVEFQYLYLKNMTSGQQK
jgi:acetylornithine deacetylase/succinyl-diaminopimelate desuccinylase-like protein